jgi:pimeloyl-ACP methyl ester carboxylesterase
MTPGASPWWEALPEDFSRRRERFAALGVLKRIEVAGSAAMDRAVRTGTASVFAGLFAPLVDPRVARRQAEAFEFYGQPTFVEDPSTFFVRPPTVHVRRSTLRRRPQMPKDARCEDISFKGAFEPVNGAYRASYLAHEKNLTSHARHFFHGDRPRTTVIALHGFWASPYWMNAYMFELPLLFSLGLDVVMPTMPFHGVRRMERALFSGHGFISSEIAQTNEAFAHAVSDIRVLIAHLRRRGVQQIGITGLSLGGFMTALLASIEPGLAFAIPNVPVVSLVDLLLEWQPLGRLLRLAMKHSRISLPEARRRLAVHHALSYAPKLPRERLMVIAGVGDRMAPPSHARLLWEHWGEPQAYFFPGNHALHFDRGGYLRVMAKFLARAGLVDWADVRR